MLKKEKFKLWLSIIFFVLFVLFTIAICYIDVKSIGPKSSSVGFSSLNLCVHNLTGVNMCLYVITDWLGIVPLLFCFGFAILGLVQWLKRKSILKVDLDILILGGFYLVVITLYFLFEIVVINYRPILINGFLEASYPSSTTLLVLCVMPTCIMQFNARVKNKTLRKFLSVLILAFMAFMVIGRLLSGVHWFTDIIGGILLSCSLVILYSYFAKKRIER